MLYTPNKPYTWNSISAFQDLRYKHGLQHMPQFCVSNKIPKGHLRSLSLHDRTVTKAPGILWIKNGALRNFRGYKTLMTASQ